MSFKLRALDFSKTGDLYRGESTTGAKLRALDFSKTDDFYRGEGTCGARRKRPRRRRKCPTGTKSRRSEKIADLMDAIQFVLCFSVCRRCFAKVYFECSVKIRQVIKARNSRNLNNRLVRGQ